MKREGERDSGKERDRGKERQIEMENGRQRKTEGRKREINEE